MPSNEELILVWEAESKYKTVIFRVVLPHTPTVDVSQFAPSLGCRPEQKGRGTMTWHHTVLCLSVEDSTVVAFVVVSAF